MFDTGRRICLMTCVSVMTVGALACAPRRRAPAPRAAPSDRRRCVSAPPRDRRTAGGARAARAPHEPRPLAGGRAATCRRERRALQISDGVERTVDADAARAAGLTLVDLSDGWAPRIFADGATADGTPLRDGYRSVFVGLANDLTDGDGQPLVPGEHNYLELLGVPPSLSVMRARMPRGRWRATAPASTPPSCWRWTRSPPSARPPSARSRRGTLARGKRLDEAAPAGGCRRPGGAGGGRSRLARDVKAHARAAREQAAFAEVEKRIACEGLMDATRHTAGRYDTVMRAGVLDFQQKHGLMAQGDLNRTTLEAHGGDAPGARLRGAAAGAGRAGRPRRRHPRGRDGSASDGGPASYLDCERPAPAGAEPGGGWRPIGCWRRSTSPTPEDALAFFRRARAGRLPAPVAFRCAFRRCPSTTRRTASRWSCRPRSIAATSGTTSPSTPRATARPSLASAFPSLTLFVKWRGERVPLCHWRTTIGGWRVGAGLRRSGVLRVQGVRRGAARVAAPGGGARLDPAAVVAARVDGEREAGARRVRARHELRRDGARISLGLRPGGGDPRAGAPRARAARPTADNGIRTHGSFDYLSLRGRFSHGCHRLHNNLAVRLFSFILAHHRARAVGPLPLDFRRTFWWKGDLYDLRLPNRGFYFELEPPVPVETLEGRIRGHAEDTHRRLRAEAGRPLCERAAPGAGRHAR